MQTGMTYRLYHCTNLVLLVTGQFSVGACFGREKGAYDRAPKASADLSDFLASFPRPLGEGRLRAISAPFARGNLHLVIPI